MIDALQPLLPSQSLTVLGHEKREEQQRFGSNPSFNSKNKPTSAFISQLLASKHAAAVFRQKRRCSPLEARSAYLATKTLQFASNTSSFKPQINFQA